ncbi:hypothetical protein S83_003032, partial [Arachis hypogaea]
MWPSEESSDDGRELWRHSSSSSQHTAACPFAMVAEEKDCHGMPLHLATFFMFAASFSTCRCIPFRVPFRHGSISPRSCVRRFFFFNMPLRPFCVPSAM